MITINKDLPLIIQKEVAELNRLILNSTNYGSTEKEIEEVKNKIILLLNY